jgi:tetratricopeptide (TPR) repeat protein
VPALPPSDGLFRGRERELADLIAWHDQQRITEPGWAPAGRLAGRRGEASLRRAGTGRPAAGPVLLLIHGKQGVGKSAIAEELARRLGHRYPQGQLFVNFGTAGGARTPGEVLRDLLLTLGWSETEMPKETVARAILFRSLTAKKRILFVFDAARHADQVVQVLPNDPATAVIVTSRRDLSVNPDLNAGSYPLDEQSYTLEVPDEDEALDIFRAVSGTTDTTRPECAAEIVDMCGRLPAAIRSAGERVSHDGTDVCHVAGLIRPLWSRLDWLERPGRPVRAHIQTDFDRLLPEEQRALAMLALVPSPTFVPWVLSPLMGILPAQAEALVDRLAGAQLLDDVSADESFGLARYGFHPLIRLFAREQAAKLSLKISNEAKARLTDAYRELVACVIAELDRNLKAPAVRAWVPVDSGLPSRIADRSEQWMRAEYPILLWVMTAASKRRDFALCWRIGVRLGGCVPAELNLLTTFGAYRQAIQAARADDPLGLVDVLLAKGTFLAAIERYQDAEECLEKAASVARRMFQEGGTPGKMAAARREAIANRKIGEAFLQAGSYGHAAEVLDEAFGLADVAGDEDEQQLIRILLAETHHVDSPEATYGQLLDGHLTEVNRFRIFLALAESARRRGDWQIASSNLDEAMRLIRGDLRRVATVHYRMARLHLDQCRSRSTRSPDAARNPNPDGGASPPGSGGPGKLAPSTFVAPTIQAVRQAAAAAVAFRRMHNEPGLVRAHCLLARALLAAGSPVEAEQVTHAAECELAALKTSAGAVYAPLAARVKRVSGELLTYAGKAGDSRRLLVEAATAFGEHDDWATQSDLLRELDKAHQVIATENSMPPSVKSGDVDVLRGRRRVPQQRVDRHGRPAEAAVR